jgi:hypothetical protein
MKRILGSRKRRYLVRAIILLLVVALLAGMAACGVLPSSENLEVRTWYGLDAIRHNLKGHHILMNDLDSTTPGYEELASPTANGGKGWDPIGYLVGEGGPIFRGTFDGQGHEIRDLYINRPDDRFVGLFGFSTGVIRNVGVVNFIVIGGDSVGGLAGSSDTVSDSYCIGSVVGNKWVGGLVGGSDISVSNSHFTGIVIGGEDVGGLSGEMGSSGTVSNCSSSSSVAGEKYIGGLVGENWGVVSNSCSMGGVTGQEDVGGLVGNNGDTVSNSYSSANVIGGAHVGGLAGLNGAETFIATVSYCYSIGSVTGDSLVGGLVGRSIGGTASDCFWDTETSGQATSAGGIGKTTAQMKDTATFSAWDIVAVAVNETSPTYVWNIVNNMTYPFLSWQAI